MTGLVRAAWLVAPVLAAGLVHVVVLKSGTLGRLAQPLDGGRRLAGRPMLGPSKTWRGVVIMPAATALRRRWLAGFRPSSLRSPAGG